MYLFKFAIKSASNKPIKADEIRRILTNKFYIGIMKYGGEYYQGAHKLFISKKLFDEVQKQVERIERPRTNSHDFAFVGLARCGECNASITAEQHIKKYKNGGSQTFIYYRCTKKLKPCTQKYISESELEVQVRKLIDDVALPQEWADDWYKWMEEDEKEELKLAEENIKNLQIEIRTLDEKLNKLLDAYLEGIIEPEVYKNKKNEVFEQKLKVNEEIEKIQKTGSSWLEPMKEWVGSALSCAKIARAKNTCHDLAIMAKTVGSNLLLLNRQLSVNLNQGFATLCATPPAQRDFNSAPSKSLSVIPTIYCTDYENSLKYSFL